MNPAPLSKRVKPQKSKKQQNTYKLPIFAMIAFVIGGGFYFTNKANQPEELDAQEVVSAVFVTDEDDVPQHLQDQRLADFKQGNKKKGGFDVQIFDQQTANDKITNSSDMSETDRTRLLEVLVENPHARVAELILWDDVAEDGDVVTVSSLDMSQQVALMHAHKTIYVPVVNGKPVVITGVRDGGGGITLAFAAGGGTALTPVIREGESVEVLLY
ncbi:Uncharacterised protein [Moraxella caprae]|uniref:Uncharacterized protein n=1 Tax=Moraxella caprae TaxID=90240 RepID=A0A378QXF2_9GAMM|nr:hypothetical protein [Moraxella caprae]STZ07654.1 Uncharacterised protein [Moraxella caprae]